MKITSEIVERVCNEYIPFNKYIGLRFIASDGEGHVKMELPFKDELLGDPRIQAIHGGVLAAGLDVAGGMAAMTTLTSIYESISTIDMRIDFLRSARSCDLVFEGLVTRKGNKIVTTSMKAYRKDDGTILAEGRGVYNMKREQKS